MMKKAVILLLCMTLLLTVLPISEDAEGQFTWVMITGVTPSDENWTFVEGSLMSFDISLFSPSPTNVTLSVFSYSNEVWRQNATAGMIGSNVTASFIAVYGMREIIFTGTSGDDIIPPVSVQVDIRPGVIVRHTGSSPAAPHEGDELELYFEIENTITAPMENATLTLYRYPSLAGMIGFSDPELIEVDAVEGIDIPAEETVNITLVWDEVVWGSQQLAAILNRTGGGTPYFVQENALVEVEDYEESPAPALTSFAMVFLYFPLAIFAMMTFYSSTKR